jgi:nucleoside phosphorylase
MALHLELPVSLNVLDAAILEALPLGEEGYRREQIASGLVVYEIRNWVLRVDAERSEALGREMKHWVYEGKAGELRLRELDSGKTEIVWKGIHTFSHRLTSEGQVWEEGNRQEWEQKDKHLRRVLLSLLRNLEHDEALKRALGAERMFYEAPILQNWEMLYNDYVSVRLPTALEEQQAAAQRGVEAVELHLASGEQAKPQADSGAVTAQLTPAEDKGGKKPGPMDTKGVDFLLVTALEEERDAVLDKLPGYQKLPPFKDDIRTYFQAQLPMTFSDGETGNYRVIVMPLLGMGRVQAATATADAITRWHPRYIMLVGIAGGVAARGVSIGDILIADQIVDYELQKLTSQDTQVRWEVQRAHPRLLNACHNFMGESWQELLRIERPARSKPKRHTGPIASGDKVIAFGDILERHREAWPKLIGVEMEAAGVATAAFQSSEPPGFFMVRCVSDLADENKGSADVEKWRSYACDAAASFAIALLKSGPVHLLDRGHEQL